MRVLLALSFVAFASVATAEERPNTVLVMDGSGSMWGQVDGVAKITIAQEVVGALLSDFPADQGLGLTVYGHRERGVCTDIETVVAPAPGTAAQITDSVNRIKPLGKTPMTDAVIAAAKALRYTEDKATVILVSDGVETCNPDPCAAARLLEEAGIDFTAHVIGFDVGSDAEALAQMECIASETGGKFLTADTADQLTDALTQVSVAEPEPEPAIVPTTFTAAIEGSNTLVSGPVIWGVNSDTEVVVNDTSGNPLTIELAEGSYTATAYSAALEMERSQQFIAIGDAASVDIAFPEPKETARILAPAEAVAGSIIQVGWNGPNYEEDYIGIGKVDAEGANRWKNWTYTANGNPLELLVPPVKGPHSIHYYKHEGRESLGSLEILVTPVDATINAPDTAPAGSQITVEWTGPDYPEDFIGIGKTGSEGANRWENWTNTADGPSASLTVPAEPGDYEITYFMRQDQTAVHAVPITVTDVAATIIAPTEALAGSTIEVGWTGPDYSEDYIGIGRVDAEGGKKWENWVYTREGNPIDLIMPPEPGEYLITYFERQDRTPLVSVPITLKPLTAEVTAQDQAIAGETIEVTWTGPNYPDDYIGIGRVDATGGKRWENWVYTRDGSPLRLPMPSTPGEYVISYYQMQGRTALSSTPISLTEPTATLSAEAQAIAGSTLNVTWAGPDYKDDYIGIGRVDASGGKQWESWDYTRNGNPLAVTVPSTAGDYEVSYFLRQDRTKLTTIPISVQAPTSRLIAPKTAKPGSTIQIGWEGPDYKDDYIGIGLVGASGGKQWETWDYVRNGNPAEIEVPKSPGEYKIRYFMRLDRTVLTEETLIVE